MRRRTILSTLLAAVLIAVTFVAVRPALAAQPVRIMPLGDSITGSPGCWRALLWNQLRNAGYQDIDFVGTLPAPGCGVAYDGDNEGHGGFLATNIANQNLLPGWLSATRPDVVTMHLGTNDVWSNIAPATILTAFSKLVDQMRASNPTMKILVAQILPMNPSNCAQCGQRVVNLNAAIPAWASAKSTTQSPITVVDQWTGFNTATDTGDGVHPNNAGNQKLAAKWFGPLTRVLADGPGTPPTTPPGSGGLVRAVGAGKCLDVPGSSQANNIQLAIWDCSGGSNQRWAYTSGKQLMVYGTKCLDAFGHGRTNGTAVILWDCGGGANQQWTVNANGTITGVESGLCLDVTGGSSANGALVQLWTCSGVSQQQWRLDSVVPSSPPSGPTGGAPALHVSGNRLVTSSGATYRLLGVNRSGGEFACIQGGGMWNGPMDQASITAMKTWNVRTVRVPLNEECWLGTGSVPSGGAGGATYQNNVKAYVDMLLSNGITPLLEMHWNYGQYTGPSSGCADVKATCQKPMPDAQYAPSFWTGVANAFKDNRVVFDLFNEPYPERATGNATSGWRCWRDGGTCAGIGYQVAGFQSLVNAVRATGNTNVILLGGLAYSNGFVSTIMNWADAHGVGYLGWTWNNWNCSSGPSLITDYNGTPTTFGAGIKARLLGVTA